MEDFTKKINPTHLESAVEMLRGSLGNKEAEKIKQAAENSDAFRELTKNISEKDLDMVVKVINNPEALKMILSSQKAREGLKNFLK